MYTKLKKNSKDVFYFVVLIFLSALFFIKLFYPQPAILITPEYTRSDITHFYIPLKKSLSEALKTGRLPLWEKDIGSGFPLLAESQVSPFYIPNAILFYFFSYWAAFNLSLVLSLALAATGMYLLMRSYQRSPEASFFTAFAFAFSGFFMGHINHFNIIQAAALLPWLMWLFNKFVQSFSGKTFLLVIILLSQQLFAGHVQVVFITLMGISFMLLMSREIPLPKRLRLFIALLVASGIAGLMSLVQLLPTKELVDLSTRSGGLDQEGATLFSFSWRHLLTILDPFALGTVSNGSYVEYLKDPGNIFWENSAYFGLIPLLLMIYGFLKARSAMVWRLICAFGLFLLLAAGKYSPLYFIFSIPPFNYFRVPSRFLLLVVFFATIAAGFGLEQFLVFLKQKRFSVKAVSAIILLLTVSHSFFLWYRYHPAVPVNQYLQKPPLVTAIKKPPAVGRVYSYNSNRPWTESFTKKGWKNNLDFYVYARNELSPNVNLLWNIPHSQIYGGNVWIRRYVEYDRILQSALSGLNNAEPEKKKLAEGFLNMSNIQFIITAGDPPPLDSLQLITAVTDQSSDTKYSLYENVAVFPRARMVYDFRTAETLEELREEIAAPDFDPAHQAILEETVDIESSAEKTDVSAIISINKNQDEVQEFSVTTSRKGLLILADMYYPGWQAFVDGKTTRIYPANLMQRAIIVEKGKHKVVFSYQPNSFQKGLQISLLAHAIVLLAMCLLFSARGRTSFPKLWPRPRP